MLPVIRFSARSSINTSSLTKSDALAMIKTKIKVVHPMGVIETEAQPTAEPGLDIVDQIPMGLGNLANKRSVHAASCIYCGSTEQLSNEHVIPYAWGGNLQIFNGSCEVCRQITSQFENFALNDGAMAQVRKERGIQSRSGHAGVGKEVTVTLLRDGLKQIENFPVAEVPLILGFPWFGKPRKLEDDSHLSNGLKLEGWVTTSYGKDVQEFLSAQGATEMQLEESVKRPVDFARMLAKIAYGYAWIDGVFDTVHGGDDLVRAFMHEPERIGEFVGMKPPPFERYPDYQLRLEYKLSMPKQLVCMEVQSFADTPAPTYQVVLGCCDSVREWRRLRSRFATGFEKT